MPIIVLWAPLVWLLVRRRIARSQAPRVESLRVGALLLATNMLLDLTLVVGVMGTGLRFYSYAGPWLAYSELILIPWMIGRAASRV